MTNTAVYLISAYILFSGGFAWVMALGQLFSAQRKLHNFFLAGHFFLVGIGQVSAGLFLLGVGKKLGFNLYVLAVPSYFFAFPLMHFYGQMVIEPHHEMKQRHLLHFVLPLLSVLLLAPLINSPVPDLYPAMNFFVHENYSLDELLMVSVLYLSMLVVLYYQVSFLLKVKQLLKSAAENRIRLIMILLRFTWVILIIAISWFLDRLFTLNGSHLIYAAMGTVLLAVYLLGIRYPELMLMVSQEAAKIKYIKSQVEHLDINAVIEKLENLMHAEKLFLKDDLNLKDLGGKLDITPHQLSEILNHKLDKSFTQLINGYRIEEAKLLLLKFPERKILAVAFDVGFNSPSAFYNAFQKFVGTSPTRFREQNTA